MGCDGFSHNLLLSKHNGENDHHCSTESKQRNVSYPGNRVSDLQPSLRSNVGPTCLSWLAAREAGGINGAKPRKVQEGGERGEWLTRDSQCLGANRHKSPQPWAWSLRPSLLERCCAGDLDSSRMQGRGGGALASACLRISLSTSQAHLGGPQSPSAFFLACMDGSSLRTLWQCLVSDVQQTVDKAPALFRDLRHTDAFVGFCVVLHNAIGPGTALSSSLYTLLEVGERELRGKPSPFYSFLLAQSSHHSF